MIKNPESKPMNYESVCKKIISIKSTQSLTSQSLKSHNGPIRINGSISLIGSNQSMAQALSRLKSKNGSIYFNSSNFSHWLTQWLTQGSYI